MTGKLIKWPQNIPTYSTSRLSKIYPNWYFWFENIPSGNPGPNPETEARGATKTQNLTKFVL
jgi:hypothetical protein